MINIETHDLVYKDIDEIFELIGQSLSENELQIFPKSKKQLYKIGVRWWKNNKNKIIDIVCNEDNLESFIEKDEIQLTLAVSDLISGSITGVAPFIVSALIVKYGIKNLCKK